MKYRKFYSVCVIDEILDGHTVYVLDRQTKTVEVINDMTVNKMMEVLNSAKADTTDRYEFWCEVKVTQETEVTEETEDEVNE